MSRVARLGAFIIVTLILLAAGIFVIGSKQYLFQSTYMVKSQFTNVIGLQQGADVRAGGVHIGTVRKLLLPQHAGEKITIVMGLDHSTREILRKDSVATIETEGLLGNQYVAISFGSADAAKIADGGTITGIPPLELAALLQKTSDILDSSQKSVNNLTLATDHLKSITGKIDSGQGTVGELINDKALYNNLQETTANLASTSQHAEAGITDFQENMEALKHNFFLSGYFKKRGYEDSAELTANEVQHLPSAQAVKTFSFPAKKLFDGRETAKLKNGKDLAPGGEFLAGNDFGFAVIAVSTGMQGDSKKDLVLAEARAAVVREYLVEHYGFDDAKVKTLGQGKIAGSEGGNDDWGTVQILIYPTGTEAPPEVQPNGGGSAQPVTASPKQ